MQLSGIKSAPIPSDEHAVGQKSNQTGGKASASGAVTDLALAPALDLKTTSHSVPSFGFHRLVKTQRRNVYAKQTK
jgi:hypothetical protein